MCHSHIAIEGCYITAVTLYNTFMHGQLNGVTNTYVYIYVYVYVRTYVLTYTPVYIHTYIYIFRYVYIRTYVRIYIYIYTQPAEIQMACQHATCVPVTHIFNTRQTRWSTEQYHGPEHSSCAINRTCATARNIIHTCNRYVRMYIRIYIYTYVYKYIYIYVYIYVRTYMT